MFAHCDFLSLNRYNGWYDMPGQLERAEAHLRAELTQISARWRKPMLLTEFGADAIPGMHATSAQLFTEEYQADFIATYWRVIENVAGCIGGHIWNFADFRTAQHHRRVQFNHKGVLTRTRDPKLAAWRVRELWHR
jgi:beta-glucuronidase